ncbi:MAG: UvrD-helicase domain-containing protein [Flavobacteriaceae bacterium]|nr:UvrD-helicase domain-containing protein [Flavobacteriaceae bacterium]
MQEPSVFNVFNASAGSGKTYMLVKEYLKVLLSTSDINRFKNILAITFTNKAAAEMKDRVLSNLRDFAKAEIVQKKTKMFIQLERETNIQDVLLHERSKKVLQSILYNYSAFNITTIDSFTHRLIRNFAFDLGLSLNFDVEMDARSLLYEAVDLLISNIGEDQELTKVLIDFSLQKANEDKSWDISRELKEIAQILLNENDLLHVQELKDKSLQDFVDLKATLQKRLKSIREEFTEIGKQGLQLIDDHDLNHGDFYRSMIPNHFKKLAADFKSAKFFDQSKLKERIDERNFYSKSKSDDIKTTIEQIIDPLLELYEQSENLYKEYALYSLFLGSLIPLAVLSKINKSLEALKEEKNIHLHAEFNQLISKHLRTQPAPFIYERIGERYKHYFIDEMQDTSKLQWQNLRPLIENALSQENSSLLLVGDAKQSFYRWRGGKAEQFIGLSKNENPFFTEKKVSPLTINYRSYSEIINFNNNFFQFISKYFKKQSYLEIYLKENQQKTTDKIGGYVNLSFIQDGLLAADKDKVYAEKVLEVIDQTKGNYDYNEICVLTRTRKQGVNIANHLTENGIDIISSETLLLENSRKVQFIIHLLSYLQQQSNKEAQLEVLYFVFDHQNIQQDKHHFISELIDCKTEDFFETLKNYSIDFNYRTYSQLPFYESVEYMIRSFKLTKTSDAYLHFFLDEVLSYSIRKSEGAKGFLEYWHEKKDKLSVVVPEEKNAVRIMTIHKSKGLEFPVVIFAYDLDIYRELNPKTWYPITKKEKFHDFDRLLVNVNKSLENVSDTGSKLYQQRRNELELDNINLLYVTLTRAIEQLYIISEKRTLTDEPKWFSQFFIEYLKAIDRYGEDQDEYNFGSKERKSKKDKALQKSFDSGQFISSSWLDHNINIVAASNLLWDSEVGTSIIYGNLIHEILAKIKTKTDIENVIELYVLNGTISSDQISSISRTINDVVEHPFLKDYFQQNLEVYCEREIVTSDKEIIIPDRIVIDENSKTTIIDYKTGKPDKKYHSQLQKYERSVNEIGLQVEKKLLVYIDEAIVIEEVH